MPRNKRVYLKPGAGCTASSCHPVSGPELVSDAPPRWRSRPESGADARFQLLYLHLTGCVQVNTECHQDPKQPAAGRTFIVTAHSPLHLAIYVLQLHGDRFLRINPRSMPGPNDNTPGQGRLAMLIVSTIP